MNSNVYIWTDASCSPPHSIAVGGYICLTEGELHQLETIPISCIKAKINSHLTFKDYLSKKSTWTEIKIILDVLSLFSAKNKITLFTDCQTVCDLLKRKEKLEKNHFKSRTGCPLTNAALYQAFFEKINQLQVNIIKLKGHHPSTHQKTVFENIFAILDKECRKKLRSKINF